MTQRATLDLCLIHQTLLPQFTAEWWGWHGWCWWSYLLKTTGKSKFIEFSIKLRRIPATARIQALSFQWPCSFHSFSSPSAAVLCCHGVLSPSFTALPPPVPWGSDKIWEGLLNVQEANWIKKWIFKRKDNPPPAKMCLPPIQVTALWCPGGSVFTPHVTSSGFLLILQLLE